MSLLAELHDPLTLQGGQVAVRQAEALGVSRDRLYRAVGRGELAMVQPGVVRLAALDATPDRELAAALLAVPDDRAVASHESAAHLLGIPCFGVPTRPNITIAGRSTLRLRGVTVHRTMELDTIDRTRRRGFACTTGERTTIDLARFRSEPDVIAFLDEGICARQINRERLHARAVALENGRWGVGGIIRVTRPGAEGDFWSWLERTFDDGRAARGIRAPDRNVAVDDVDGKRIGIVDTLWRPERVIVDLRGLRFHDKPAQRRRDDAVTNELAIAGYLVLVVWWKDLMERPDRVYAQLAKALRSRARR